MLSAQNDALSGRRGGVTRVPESAIGNQIAAGRTAIPITICDAHRSDFATVTDQISGVPIPAPESGQWRHYPETRCLTKALDLDRRVAGAGVRWLFTVA